MVMLKVNFKHAVHLTSIENLRMTELFSINKVGLLIMEMINRSALGVIALWKKDTNDSTGYYPRFRFLSCKDEPTWNVLKL
ncbi:hypothetical protein X798_00498 [Onchocerca flexuosa]|uniref:Uncharacterized protein n=1 Tax=Onchocerca flexuosa TaxID=387005 RepID=A0A238C5Y7_9BILA|nr:hypothetical protein X798_00498 [Onchocerca flexuosa]